MARETKVAFWTSQVAQQKAWIDRCGGDLAGYVKTYGSKDDPKHSGDGGEAIYAADTGALKKYEEELTLAKVRAGVA